MRSCLQEQRRSVDRGTCGPGIQPRKFLPPGRRRCKEKRKAPSGGTYGTNEEVQPGTASRENATSGVWSVCDRPTAVAWRRETGDVQLPGLYAHLREEEEQWAVYGVAANDTQKVANETERGESRTSATDA